MFSYLKELPEVRRELLFSDEMECYKVLSEIKWNKGYVCKKCGHTNFCEGKKPYSRRCTRCKHDESPQTDTPFHGCRFPLNKAFFIAYHTCFNIDRSTHALSRDLDIRQMTCWSFKKKLQECLATSSIDYKFT